MSDIGDIICLEPNIQAVNIAAATLHRQLQNVGHVNSKQLESLGVCDL